MTGQEMVTICKGKNIYNFSKCCFVIGFKSNENIFSIISAFLLRINTVQITHGSIGIFEYYNIL